MLIDTARLISKDTFFLLLASEKMLKAWKEMEEKAIHYSEVKSLNSFCVFNVSN
jgi:hypothetical protein